MFSSARFLLPVYQITVCGIQCLCQSLKFNVSHIPLIGFNAGDHISVHIISGKRMNQTADCVSGWVLTKIRMWNPSSITCLTLLVLWRKRCSLMGQL